MSKEFHTISLTSKDIAKGILSAKFFSNYFDYWQTCDVLTNTPEVCHEGPNEQCHDCQYALEDHQKIIEIHKGIAQPMLSFLNKQTIESETHSFDLTHTLLSSVGDHRLETNIGHFAPEETESGKSLVRISTEKNPMHPIAAAQDIAFEQAKSIFKKVK